MTKYQDPENVDEIITKLKLLPTMKEVKKLIEEVYPNWFITILPQYSNDYKQLQTNWVNVANKIGVPICHIIIVDDMIFDDNHTLIRTFAELLTRAGFSVRRKEEFFPCQVCGNAIPSKQMYEIYSKTQELTIPETWSSKCKEC